ncbi:MAG: diacylglycerol/lipid kinase family protein, partial [Planctomycetota bacterium]
MRRIVYITNAASGGGQGAALLAHGRADARTVAAGDLSQVDALVAQAANGADLVLACGGDGTAAAVLSAIVRRSTPWTVPVAVVPLGTGNDLARALGWAGLAPLACADLLSAGDLALTTLTPLSLSGPDGVSRPWYNYLSVGYDAQVAARFDRARRRHPRRFCSAWVNRLWYGWYGLTTAAPAFSCRLIGEDGQDVGGTGLANLILANIASYGGGGPLAAAVDSARPGCAVIRHHSRWSYMRAALGSGRSVATSQAVRWQIEVPVALPAQLDGEHLTLAAGSYQVAPLPALPLVRYPPV